METKLPKTFLDEVEYPEDKPTKQGDEGLTKADLKDELKSIYTKVSKAEIGLIVEENFPDL
jgi:hypothetical protein